MCENTYLIKKWRNKQQTSKEGKNQPKDQNKTNTEAFSLKNLKGMLVLFHMN